MCTADKYFQVDLPCSSRIPRLHLLSFLMQSVFIASILRKPDH
jgi:hypothetical protein